MDSKMPQIKTEVNKVDDGKKKSSGLLGLLGGGGGGAGGGLGGLGAGAASGGGLLATKAGMIALVLMGSAVAGGIGLAGYKMFGPNDADKVGGASLQLFQPKPQAADPNAVAPVNADGSSASLNYMAQAAAKVKTADGADAAPTDKTAGSAAADAAAQAAKDKALNDASARTKGNEGPINSGGGAGAVGSMGKGLAGVKKLGALSGAGGSSGGGSVSSSARGGNLGDGLTAGSRNGATSGFVKGGPGAKGNASSSRGAMAGRGRNATAQMRSIIGDHQGGKVNSSFAAGKTYDGSATQSGGAIGPDGSAIGMDGVGDGKGAQPKSLEANSAKNSKDQQPPIPKTVDMVSPWTAAVARAQMLMVLALALAFLASKVYIPWVRIAIGIAIMAIGGYIGVLAGQIMSGKHKQELLGGLVRAAAVGTIIMGAMTMASGNKEDCKDPGNSTTTSETTKSTPNADGSVTKTTTTSGGAATGIMSLPPPLLYGGGIVAIGLLGSFFAPKPKPIQLEDGEKKPDVRIEQRVNPTRYTV